MRYGHRHPIHPALKAASWRDEPMPPGFWLMLELGASDTRTLSGTSPEQPYHGSAVTDDLPDGPPIEEVNQTFLLASAADSPERRAWSWNEEDFKKHLDPEDPLSVVLRGLLYIEGALRAMIALALPRPDVLRLDRLDFPTKVRFVLALSLLHEKDVAPLLALNALRNRLAHELGSNATDDDAQALIRSLSPGQKFMFDSQSEANSKFPNNLRLIIAVLMVQLDHEIKRLSVTQGQWKEILQRLKRMAKPYLQQT